MDTDAFHGVKKCAEVIFKDGKMVKGEKLTVLEKHKRTRCKQKEALKLLGFEQVDK